MREADAVLAGWGLAPAETADTVYRDAHVRVERLRPGFRVRFRDPELADRETDTWRQAVRLAMAARTLRRESPL